MIFIVLCGRRKAMVIPAKARPVPRYGAGIQEAGIGTPSSPWIRENSKQPRKAHPEDRGSKRALPRTSITSHDLINRLQARYICHTLGNRAPHPVTIPESESNRGGPLIAYSVNVSYLMPDLPIRERLRRVRDAGFEYFEWLFPQRIDIDELVRLKDQYALTMVLLDTEVDVENPRGQLSNPGAGDAFFARLDEAVEIARTTGTRLINTLCGLSLPGVERELQVDTLISRLKQAAPLAEAEGITLLVEALNHFDNPGYLITNSKDGFRIVDAVDSPNVKFQYDLYHMQLMEGNLINTVRENLDKIGHMQLADVPGRLPPRDGEINFPNVLKAIEEAGYHGFVGLEYRWPPDHGDPFAWLPPEARRRTL